MKIPSNVIEMLKNSNDKITLQYLADYFNYHIQKYEDTQNLRGDNLIQFKKPSKRVYQRFFYLKYKVKFAYFNHK